MSQKSADGIKRLIYKDIYEVSTSVKFIKELKMEKKLKWRIENSDEIKTIDSFKHEKAIYLSLNFGKLM